MLPEKPSDQTDIIDKLIKDGSLPSVTDCNHNTFVLVPGHGWVRQDMIVDSHPPALEKT